MSNFDILKEFAKQLLLMIVFLGYVSGHYLLCQWMYGTLGIGGLIGWGLGFFLVTGWTYLFFEERKIK